MVIFFFIVMVYFMNKVMNKIENFNIRNGVSDIVFMDVIIRALFYFDLVKRFRRIFICL